MKLSTFGVDGEWRRHSFITHFAPVARVYFEFYVSSVEHAGQDISNEMWPFSGSEIKNIGADAICKFKLTAIFVDFIFFYKFSHTSR